MTRQSYRELWGRIYDCWLSSGQRVSDFHRGGLGGLWPQDRPLPSSDTTYHWFGRIRQERAGASSIVTHTIAPNARLVEIDPAAFKRAAASYAGKTAPAAAARIFHMQLPCGTCIDLETTQPEALALQLFALSRRSS